MSLPAVTLAILVLTIIQGTGVAKSSEALEPFLHRYGYTHNYDKGRFKRQIRSILLMAQNRDYRLAEEDAQTVVVRLRTMENNINHAGPHFENGSAAYNAMLISNADKKASNISRTAYINTRASHYISSTRCIRFIENPFSCAEELKMLPVKKKTMDCPGRKYRTFDGFCNNFENPTWGTTYSPYERLFSSIYLDGIWKENKFFKKLPNALIVSQGAAKMVPGSTPATRYTLSLAGWANLVTYDLSHTVSYKMLHSGAEIVCCTQNNLKASPRYLHPLCMPIVDKEGKCVNYVRSMLSTPNDQKYGPAQQMNMASHYLDGSSIYGSTSEIAESNRLKYRGLIKDLDHQCMQGQSCLFSGDIRPKMDPVTAVIHFVLIREHNRVANALHKLNPTWDDEILFQEARRIVIGEIQHITYYEWLPNIIGGSLSRHSYDMHIHPGVYNSFANAASYFSLSLFPTDINLYNEDRSINSSIPWRYTLVDPDLITNKDKFDSLMRTISTESNQGSNFKFTKAVTEHFLSKNNEGLNSISLIVQRGRDHGLATYADFRKLFGFTHNHFEDFIDDIPPANYKILKKLYSNVSTIDLFIGGMAESPKNGALVGPILSKIISRQMMLTRVGDKFFYENSRQKNSFTPEQLHEIRKSSLARLLCDNSENIHRMQQDAFKVIDKVKNNLFDCSNELLIRRMNLTPWKESSE